MRIDSHSILHIVGSIWPITAAYIIYTYIHLIYSIKYIALWPGHLHAQVQGFLGDVRGDVAKAADDAVGLATDLEMVQVAQVALVHVGPGQVCKGEIP